MYLGNLDGQSTAKNFTNMLSWTKDDVSDGYVKRDKIIRDRCEQGVAVCDQQQRLLPVLEYR